MVGTRDAHVSATGPLSSKRTVTGESESPVRREARTHPAVPPNQASVEWHCNIISHLTAHDDVVGGEGGHDAHFREANLGDIRRNWVDSAV